MELKEGMYVRTTYGDIAKIIGCPKVLEKEYGKYMWIETMDEQRPTDDKLIKKASYNIIDLIEEGDYVNDKRVEWIGYDLYRENEDKTLTGIGEKRILFNEFTKDSVREKGIKSIVTKEQFESMKYEVK